MESYNVPEERITIVRNGPDLDRLRIPELAQTKSNPPGKITICYAGVMGQQDGVDYLLRAINHLIVDLQRSDFTCVLVGDGNASTELQRLATELGLSDHVSFTGWVPRSKAFDYMSTADICVAPEPSNNYNDRSTMVKISEYMSLGKAIVAFDLPEHRVTAQNAALYAQPNDELDFAQKILDLMDSPSRREQMGNDGKHRVINRLAWSHQEKNLIMAYDSINVR